MIFEHKQIARAIILALAACAGTTYAQTSDAERMKAMERKIEMLMNKIEQLEKSNTASAQAATPGQADKVAALEKRVVELSTGLSRRGDDGLPVHGFADVGLAYSGENNPTFKGRKGAALGVFDLYLTPKFGDRVRALVELAFEATQDGEIATDLERLQIGYLFNDAAMGWLGRFHTPYGYWNTAFHHGAQIQTSLNRPRFLEFEDKGGILPAHSTGIWFNGMFGSNTGRFGYDAYVANAPQINGATNGSNLAAANPTGFSPVVDAGTYAGSGTLSMRQSGSLSHRNAVGFNAWFEPRMIDGLRVGLHGLRAEVIDDSDNRNQTMVNMKGGYFAYTADPWEVLGEYYHFRNADKGGGSGTHSSWAAYAQAGYNIGLYTPYFRVERANLDQQDNYFAVQESGRSYRRWAAGIRYDVDPKAALKFEFASTRKEIAPGLSDRYPDLRVQYAIGF